MTLQDKLVVAVCMCDYVLDYIVYATLSSR